MQAIDISFASSIFSHGYGHAVSECMGVCDVYLYMYIYIDMGLTFVCIIIYNTRRMQRIVGC